MEIENGDAPEIPIRITVDRIKLREQLLNIRRECKDCKHYTTWGCKVPSTECEFSLSSEKITEIIQDSIYIEGA